MEAVTAPREAPTLDSPELFVNREVSWLQFNERVLELAEDERVPLLERVKFLAIYADNLDEFVLVRVAGLHDQVDAGIDARGPDGLSARETIERITERADELGRRHSRAWEEEVRPALAEHGIRVVDIEDCSDEEQEAIDRLFAEQIFPVLTPLAVGPGRPFPYISNLSLSIGVFVRDPVSEVETFARVKVPKEVLPRFVPIGDDTFVPLELVIARNLDELFPGMEILRHDFFRVTRDADFTVSDEADDLLRAVEDELRRRRFGEVVRLEVASTMDPDMRDYLIEQLAIDETQVVDVDGLLDLNDLWSLNEIDGPPRASLRAVDAGGAACVRGRGRRRGRTCSARSARATCSSTTPTTRSPGSVERFISQASRDPDVLAIKITVYRTSDDSALVPALIEAAERGKQAVCLVELKARFDERRNIGWARVARGGGRARGPRAAGAEDAREGRAGGAPRGIGRAALRARRDGELPRQDGAAVRGLRPVHVRPRDRRGRGGAVQHAHRRGAHARVPARRRCARPHAQLVPRRGRAHDRGQARRARTRASR